MKNMVKWIDRRFYGDYQDNWDNILFREEVLRRLGKGCVALDLGAGAGIVPQIVL